MTLTKPTGLYVRVPQALADALRAQAKREEVPIALLCRRLLKEGVEKMARAEG